MGEPTNGTTQTRMEPGSAAFDAARTTPQLSANRDTTPQTPDEAARAVRKSLSSDEFRLSGYEICGELARGGMGIVYSARDTRLNRDVAVKVLQEKYDVGGSTARRFVEEARITGQLQHPGVPPVHELSTLPDGRPVMVMKLIKGETLAALLGASDRPDVPRLLQIFERICQTVAYAHDRKVIHRDLKPSNVMVGAFGEVQVMDWGLAKVLGENSAVPDSPEQRHSESQLPVSEIVTERTPDSQTQTGSMLGTPAYMPPEQAKGEIDCIDRRSDVFSLGAILCELLTGKPPYLGNSLEIRLKACLCQTGEAFGRLDQSGADPELVTLCKACLAPERSGRPTDAGEVAATVAAYHVGVEARARQAEVRQAEAAGERRRRKALAWAAGVVTVVFSTGAGVSAWYKVRANDNEIMRLQAEKKADEADREKRLERAQSSIRVALKSGNAEQVVTAFDDAVATGLPVTSALRLDKVRALFALERTDAALAELGRVDRAGLSVQDAAQADLLEGALRIGGFDADDTEAERLIRKALDGPLPEADRHYAKGLIAETTPQALAEFEAAIRADPAHVDARAMSVLIFISLGRLQDAIQLGEQSRALAPHHPSFTTLLAYAWAIDGDVTMATRYLDGLRPLFDDRNHYEVFRELIRFVAQSFAQVKRMASPSPGYILNVLWQLLNPGGPAMKAIQAFREKGSPTASGLPSRVPRYLRTDFKFIADEMVYSQPQLRIALATLLPEYKLAPSVFQFTDKAGEEAARKLLERHPDGSSRSFFAGRLYNLVVEDKEKNGWSENARQKLYAAATELEIAGRTPGLFNRQISLLEDSYVAYTYAGSANSGLPKRMDWCKKGFAVLTDWLQIYGPLKDADQFHYASITSLEADEFATARVFLDQWKKTGKLDAEYYRIRAVVEYHLGAYGIALDAIEKIPAKLLRDDPEINDVRAECRQKLRLPELAPPPRPTSR